MNEKNYRKRLDFQQKIISRLSNQIEGLKLENENLKLKLEEKDKTINSVASLKNELTENIKRVKKHKAEYKKLIDELRKMKEIVNQTVYKGRWWLVKHLIK